MRRVPARSPCRPEQAAREQALVEKVIASFEGTELPRLKQLMQARHLHAFAREVRLIEP